MWYNVLEGAIEGEVDKETFERALDQALNDQHTELGALDTATAGLGVLDTERAEWINTAKGIWVAAGGAVGH